MSAISATYIAGQSIAANTIVMLSGANVVPFDSSLESNFSLIVGLCTANVPAGGVAVVVSSGTVIETGIFTPAIYYVQPNGSIALTYPTSETIVVAGYATDINTFIVDIRQITPSEQIPFTIYDYGNGTNTYSNPLLSNEQGEPRILLLAIDGIAKTQNVIWSFASTSTTGTITFGSNVGVKQTLIILVTR